jgi:predicted Rossmann fold flavoprotein
VLETEVCLIGGGAAGILAAWRAASLGAKVLVLEKTPRLGTKILISGGGKCNITHDGEVQDVLRAFRSNEAKFLRPSMYKFTNRQIVEMLTSRGLQVYTRADGRIFPVDRTAKDVVAILGSFLDELGVETKLETPCTGIHVAENGRLVVQIPGGACAAKAVVLAVGGSSYPNSGTTGDGWAWARTLGHRVAPVRAALAPINLVDAKPDWSGVPLRDCVLKARQDGKEIARWRNDLLFTHHGISGPTALGISREVAEAKVRGPVELEVDVTPDRSFEALTEHLVVWSQANPKKTVQSFVDDLIPNRLVVPLLSLAGVEPSTPAGQLDRKGRNRLVNCLKQWKLGEVSKVPLDRGEVVAGGVSLDEVDPQTMASSKVPGLFLCGEVLDIAGPVGGYNLQAAFSTGWVAGDSAARLAHS